MIHLLAIFDENCASRSRSGIQYQSRGIECGEFLARRSRQITPHWTLLHGPLTVTTGSHIHPRVALYVRRVPIRLDTGYEHEGICRVFPVLRALA